MVSTVSRPNTVEDILERLVICEPSTLETGCWEWPLYTNTWGYGIASYVNKKLLVHRLVYEHFVGAIPEGLELDHLCRNACCSNFEHLEPVTGKVNSQRQRQSAPLVTHCREGHEFTEANTFWRQSGRRRCRTCSRKWDREYKKARRSA